MSSILLWHLTTLLAITGSVAEAPTGKSTWDWTTASPESQGLIPSRLESAWAELEKRHTSALLVIRHDRIVFERYAPGYSRTKPHYTASMAKALVGGLGLMVAMSDGRIGPDDPASRYVPQWRDDPKRREITVRHLATHTSGVEDAEADGLAHDRLTGWKGDFWKRLPPPNDPFTLARDRAAVLDRPGTRERLQQPRHGDARLQRDGEPPGREGCGSPLPAQAPDHGTAGHTRCGMVGGLRQRDDRGWPAPGGDLGRRRLQPRRRGQGRPTPPASGNVGRPAGAPPGRRGHGAQTSAPCRAIPDWGGG